MADLEFDSSAQETNKLDKKELRQKIKDQMEFYFSDSNLTKDRFLKKEITNSPGGYIDLSVFLKFNKIRELTNDIKQIVKSLKHSDLLELNETGTMARRKVAFVEPSQKDVDKKTIYVENLPNKSNNELIKSFFEKFGKISYISLPKFQSTNQLKGFAFIEFEEKSSAKKALEYYQSLSNSIIYDHTTIGKFPKFNAQIIDIEKKNHRLNQEIMELKKDLNDLNGDSVNTNESQTLSETQEKEPANKEKKSKEEKMELGEVDAEDHWKKLKVISKKAWLQLKEDYLNRQKQEIAELKTKFCDLSKTLESLKEERVKKQKQPPKIKTEELHRGCILKIILDSNNEEHFKLMKMTRQQFKESQIKDYLDAVAYVDLEKNSNKIFIRCKSSEHAQQLLVDEKFLCGFEKSFLRDEQEDEYFEKINSNRNKKMEKKEKKGNKFKKSIIDPENKVQQKNLKTKLKNDLVKNKSIAVESEPMAKHFKFDDDENDN